MKKIFIIIFATLFLFPDVSAQSNNTFFCLAGKEFRIPALSLSIGLTRNFKVKFDVKNLIPRNIIIVPMDSSAFVHEEYLKITKDNLQKITFLKDTPNAEITLRYIVISGRNLSKDYAEAISDTAINLVFRKKVLINRDPAIGLSKNSVILNASIKIDKPVEFRKSEILVERLFINGKDSTVIISNNFPEFTEMVLTKAKEYRKDWFLQHSSTAKRYFIKFFIVLRYPDCDDFELVY